jgi:hypothetical protein
MIVVIGNVLLEQHEPSRGIGAAGRILDPLFSSILDAQPRRVVPGSSCKSSDLNDAI